jgi:thymidine kinase
MVVEGEQVVVGDTGAQSGEVGYEVLCRRHHLRRMTAHAARAVTLSPDVLPLDADICPVPPPEP